MRYGLRYFAGGERFTSFKNMSGYRVINLPESDLSLGTEFETALSRVANDILTFGYKRTGTRQGEYYIEGSASGEGANIFIRKAK